MTHAAVCRKVCDILLSFVYKKHDEVETSTWCELFKTFLGVGDWLFMNVTAAPLFDQIGVYYCEVSTYPSFCDLIMILSLLSQTLFNMFLCCEVEDAAVWDIIVSVLFRWTKKDILIRQWKTSLV
jgi:hypothetical protein